MYQVTVPKDDAQKVINKFGTLGKVQFLDLNTDVSPLLLPFTNMLRHLEENERKLVYLIEQYHKYNVKLNPPGDVDKFEHLLENLSANRSKTIEMLNEEVQNDISQQEKFISD